MEKDIIYIVKIKYEVGKGMKLYREHICKDIEKAKEIGKWEYNHLRDEMNYKCIMIDLETNEWNEEMGRYRFVETPCLWINPISREWEQ